MDLTFKKSANSAAQFAYDGDRLVGSVIKVEGWTVRGAPVKWEAHRNGRRIGRADTRKEAAELLARLDTARRA